MDLWNQKNLDSPPINSCKSNMKEIDVKFLANTVKDAITFFENQQHLSTEAALLSRTIYRMKMKFRSAKDFKALEKLNRALLNYLQMRISKVLQTFSYSVPCKYKINESYLPTKNMMDYVLVRLQGLGKILSRILETCKIAANLAHQRLRLGHFWKMAIIIYAIVARIFVITKTLVKYTCDLYSNLVVYSNKLSNCGREWLPDGYVFPNQLNEWLNIDWLDLEKAVIEIPDDEESELSYFNLIDDSDDDVEFCDEYVIINDESQDDVIDIETSIDNSEMSTDNKKILHGFDDDIDIGEVIDITNESPPKVQNNNNNNKKRKRDTNSNTESPPKKTKKLKKKVKVTTSVKKTETPDANIIYFNDTQDNSIIVLDDSTVSKNRKKKMKKSANVNNSVTKNISAKQSPSTKNTKTPDPNINYFNNTEDNSVIIVDDSTVSKNRKSKRKKKSANVNNIVTKTTPAKQINGNNNLSKSNLKKKQRKSKRKKNASATHKVSQVKPKSPITSSKKKKSKNIVQLKKFKGTMY